MALPEVIGLSGMLFLPFVHAVEDCPLWNVILSMTTTSATSSSDDLFGYQWLIFWPAMLTVPVMVPCCGALALVTSMVQAPPSFYTSWSPPGGVHVVGCVSEK